MKRSTALFGLLVLGLGCSANDAPAGGDSDAAAEGWRAASAAMQGAQTDFAAEVDEGDEGDVTVACPEGGTVRVSGSASQDGLDFTMALVGCGSQGVVIDGELSLTGEATASGSEFQYIGELTFSGAVDMACAVDLSTRTSTSIDGMTVSAEAEVSGSICGYDASVAVST